MLETYALYHWITFAATVSVYAFLPMGAEKILYSAILQGHTVMAFLYSRKYFSWALHDRGAFLELGLLTFLTGLFFLKRFPDIALYFAVHHSMTMAYLYNGEIKKREDASFAETFAAFRFFMYMAVIVFSLRGWFIGGLPHTRLLTQGLYGCVWITAGLYALFVFKNHQRLGRAVLQDSLLSDSLCAVIIAISFFKGLVMEHMVLFHFILWFFIPLKRSGDNFARRENSRLLSQHLGAVFFFMVVVGLTLHHELFSFQGWEDWGVFLSYIHVTYSFATSSLNPGWLLRSFKLYQTA